MILLTGGSGLLGTELQKYLKCYAPSHKELDITKKIKPMKDISMIIHCAAYTDVVKAEKEKNKCYAVNFYGTLNLLEAYPNIPFVYISTEYAINPVNWYGQSKKDAENFIIENHRQYLIIRTSFIPRPFPHKYAFFDQQTIGDYVDKIAPLIVKVIGDNNWTDEIVYIGSDTKSTLELARQTKPRIKGISVNDIKGVKIPRNV